MSGDGVAWDLAATPLREVNAALHRIGPNSNVGRITILNPRGSHAVGAGLDAPTDVEVAGHVGYYCAAMNKQARVVIRGNAGTGVAENMMSGRVHVRGDASQSAGASGRGGLLVVDGNAAARCGISMKGIDIVVKGSVGHMSAFMAQSGHLVVLGDAGDSLGDSIYEARLYVRGAVASLGADCVEKAMDDDHRARLRGLLDDAGVGPEVEVAQFRRYGSARRLYNFKVDNAGAY